VCVVLGTRFSLAAVGNHIDCCRCENMYPEDIPQGVRPQIMPSPFSVRFGQDLRNPQQTYFLGRDINGRLIIFHTL